jgi:putative PEP-CTERM system histidine kinase
MLFWEQIFLIISAAIVVIFAFIAFLGKTGRFARIIFLVGSFMMAWCYFRLQNIFPPAGSDDYFLPIDISICLTILPFLCLLFSLVYAREDYFASLRRSRLGLILIGGIGLLLNIISYFYPIIILKGAYPDPHNIYVTNLGQWYFLYLIIISAMIMINLESTYRASWGVYRRKLRPSVLVVAIILSLQLISSSLVLLSGEIQRWSVPVISLLSALAIILIAIYFRKYEIQQSGVFVRQHAIYSSAGIIIIGFYLVLAGGIGKIIQIIGGDIKLFISVLGAMVVFLAILALLLSRSIKERIKGTVEKTLQSGQFDFEGELATFSEDIATLLDPDELTKKFLDMLRDKLGVGKLYLFYTDPHQDNLLLIYPRGADQKEKLKIASGGSLADWLFRHGEAMVVEDLKERLINSESAMEELKMLSRLELSISLPLIAKRRLVGILFLGPKANKEQFGHQEIQFISSIGHQFSLALFSARLSEELLAARQIESFHKFTTFVMHDLKNSVSMLLMLLQNYESNMESLEFQKSAMTTIDGAVRRMQVVMEKLRSGQEEAFKITDCNLNEILLNIESRLDLNNRNGLKYSKTLAENPIVACDLDKLQEVVRNLVINALEAMPDGGSLSMKTAEDRDRIVLTVTDNGIGMTSEFISNRLFKPFATTKQKGLGIGLFQSKEWIEKMNGKILVKSVPLKGSTISLIFRKKV